MMNFFTFIDRELASRTVSDKPSVARRRHLTAQSPEEFVNDHPDFNLGDLRVYRLICGNPDNVSSWSTLEYPTPPKHPPNTVVISANWNGYTATLRLNEDGSLTLVQFLFVTDYRKTGEGPLDFETSRVIQEVNERIPGDYWLVCAPKFGDPQTYIPFLDGRIVLDQSQWKHEPQP